jgi:hypothetical protein
VAERIFFVSVSGPANVIGGEKIFRTPAVGAQTRSVATFAVEVVDEARTIHREKIPTTTGSCRPECRRWRRRKLGSRKL